MIYLTTLTPDPQDFRDYLYEYDKRDVLPASVDLLPQVSSVPDQKNVGSCTANALTSAAEMFVGDVEFSRLFNYYCSREMLGPDFLSKDGGSTARYALKAANKFGLPREESWPYIENEWNTKPSNAAYDEAIHNLVSAYYRIPQWSVTNPADPIYGVKHALASGYPVLIGLTVGEKIYTLSGETYQCTGPTNKAVGGHEMVVIGYDDSKRAFLIQNSWGSQWNAIEGGFFWCDYSVLGVDLIDVWVMKGFAGVNTVGPDRVKKYIDQNSPQGTINRLYRACFNRAPDDGGLAYWAGELQRGVTLNSIATSFMQSAEFQAKYGAVNDAEFVSLLYQNVLGRAPDDLGLMYWTTRLNPPPKSAREDVMIGFSESAENKKPTWYTRIKSLFGA